MKSKIIFEQLTAVTGQPQKYLVTKLVNRLTPKVGSFVKDTEIIELQKDGNLTIEVGPDKKRR
jgi:hypothetical protein